MKFKKLSIVAAMSVIASSSLMAAQMPKFYAGLGVGMGDVAFPDAPAGKIVNSGITVYGQSKTVPVIQVTRWKKNKPSSIAYRGFIGAKWTLVKSPWQLGVELGYQNPVKTDYEIAHVLTSAGGPKSYGFKQTFELQTMDLQAKAFYRLPQIKKVSLSAGIGLEYAKLTNKIEHLAELSDKLPSESFGAYGEQVDSIIMGEVKYDQSHTAFLPEVSLGATYHWNEHIFLGINWRQAFGSKPAVYDKLGDAFASALDKNFSNQSYVAENPARIPESNINSMENILHKSVTDSDNKKVPGGYTVMFNVGYNF